MLFDQIEVHRINPITRGLHQIEAIGITVLVYHLVDEKLELFPILVTIYLKVIPLIRTSENSNNKASILFVFDNGWVRLYWKFKIFDE